MKYGGTQMKSNSATPTTDAAIAGPRPVRTETHTTAIRYSIAMLVMSICSRRNSAITEAATASHGLDIAAPSTVLLRSGSSSKWRAPVAVRLTAHDEQVRRPASALKASYVDASNQRRHKGAFGTPSTIFAALRSAANVDQRVRHVLARQRRGFGAEFLREPKRAQDAGAFRLR